MDMKKLMQQAQKMQKEMGAKIEEIKQKDFNFESNGVKLIMSGDLKITSLNISKDLLEDKESLEDVLSIVINEAIEKVESEKEAVYGQANQMTKNSGGGLF